MELILGQFSYKAVDRGGTHVTGVIEASDRRSAVASLADQGRYVTDLLDTASSETASSDKGVSSTLPDFSSWGGGRASSKDILAVTTQLSTAVRAGLPLLNCLELIGKQQRKPAMKRLFDDLIDSVNSGKSLSESLAEHREFSPLYLSMIRVGETGGILEETTAQLTTILKREEQVKTSIKSASAYPIFLLCLGIICVFVFVVGILPRILATVDLPVEAMPLPTRMLMGMGGFTRALFTTVPGWVGLIAVVVAVGSLRKWCRTAGRLEWDAFKLKVPVLGSVLRTIAVGRFCRTLGALTEGGVTILEALAVVRDTLGNELLARQIDEVAEKVKRGEALAEPLEASGYFPPLLIQIVAIGEQTGKLDELLLNAAETFDADADAAIKRFTDVFPPFLILILAMIIGFIIVAALLPIVNMSVGVGGM